MNERENILARIREALRVPAPKPGHRQTAGQQSAQPARADSPASAIGPEGNSTHRFRSCLPHGATTLEDRLALFQKNATDLRAEFHLLADQRELPSLLQRLRDTEKWTKIAVHSGELTDLAASALALPICRTENGYDVHDLETCSAALTECDALVAQTGSVLLTSRTAGGRALSALPPHHVVLARRNQLLSDLPEGFRLLKQRYSANYPSFISFITGPSRTGDIERILVLGAHGPKKLTIICL